MCDLNNFYPLGKTENCPVKIEFLSYLKKASIFKNIQKLKGTKIAIANDLTPKQREENQILRKHLYLAKQNEDNICFIRKTRLHVNNRVYTPEELENCVEIEDTYQVKPNSAPETLTIPTCDFSEKIKKQINQLEEKSVLNTPKTSTSAYAETSKGKKEVKETGRQIRDNKIKTRSGSVSNK